MLTQRPPSAHPRSMVNYAMNVRSWTGLARSAGVRLTTLALLTSLCGCSVDAPGNQDLGECSDGCSGDGAVLGSNGDAFLGSNGDAFLGSNDASVIDAAAPVDFPLETGDALAMRAADAAASSDLSVIADLATDAGTFPCGDTICNASQLCLSGNCERNPPDLAGCGQGDAAACPGGRCIPPTPRCVAVPPACAKGIDCACLNDACRNFGNNACESIHGRAVHCTY